MSGVGYNHFNVQSFHNFARGELRDMPSSSDDLSLSWRGGGLCLTQDVSKPCFRYAKEKKTRLQHNTSQRNIKFQLKDRGASNGFTENQGYTCSVILVNKSRGNHNVIDYILFSA